MNTLFVYSTKLLTTGIISGTAFMLSSFIAPEVAENKAIESRIPAMSIGVQEFSPAWSALEDDYYISNYDDEDIPDSTYEAVTAQVFHVKQSSGWKSSRRWSRNGTRT